MPRKIIYIETYNINDPQPTYIFGADFFRMIPEKFWGSMRCDTRDLGLGYKEAILSYDDGEEGAGELEKYLSLKKRVNDE